MKRGLVIVVFLSLILSLSLTFISAIWVTGDVTSSNCTSESNFAFCTRLAKVCGPVSAIDNCGIARSINCGTCSSGYTCSSNKCVSSSNVSATCTPESNSVFCSRLGKYCGSLTAADNCRVSRTVASCGTCATGYICSNGVSCVLAYNQTNVCGNGKIEGTEQCDGTNLNGKTCASLSAGANGTLKCTVTCKLDNSSCISPGCSFLKPCKAGYTCQLNGSCIKACTLNSECADGNSCTVDTCSTAGTCLHSQIAGCITPECSIFKACASGKTCANGVCITLCTDNDGGSNIYIKGTINPPSSQTDRCYDLINGPVASCNGTKCSIEEFYCTDNNQDGIFESYSSSVSNTPCPNGCKDGACIIPCRDSDNTQDVTTAAISSTDIKNNKYPSFYVKGNGTGVYTAGSAPSIFGAAPDVTVVKPSIFYYSIFYDYCASTTQLNEAFCSNGKLGAVGIQCPYGCKNGACVKRTLFNSLFS